jgi:hypothetical protein
MPGSYPEFVGLTTAIVGGVVPDAGRGLAILGPHTQSGDEVAVNVPVVAKIQRTADDSFGAGSAIATAFASAKASGIAEAILMGVGPRSGSPFSETFGAASAITTGTLNAARLPITSIASASRDSTNITANIVYTHQTGTGLTGLTVAANAVAINLETGEFKLGTATTGSGAGFVVTYASHDWDAAFDVLDLNSYEYAVPAGVTFSAASWGIVNKFISRAQEAEGDKMWCFGLDSGVTPATISPLVATVSGTQTLGKKGFLLADHYTGGDLTAALGATLAKAPTAATMKLQEAPAVARDGTSTYTFTDYGGELAPASGTFHYMGVNAVYRNRFGDYEMTNDRAVVGLTDQYRFHSTERKVRKARELANNTLEALRRNSSTAADMSDSGIATVKASLDGVGQRLLEDGDIEEWRTVVPKAADIPEADRAVRFLDNVLFSIRLTAQIQFIDVNLEATL